MTNNFPLQAKTFTEEFLNAYLHKQDYAKSLAMLSKDITFFNSSNETYYNYEEIYKAFNKTKPLPIIIDVFTLLNINVNSISCDNVILSGQFMLNSASCESKHLYSIICKKVENAPKIIHVHISCAQNTYNDSNVLRLSHKVTQLESRLDSITENICGGIMLYDFDDIFNIKYVSHGFTDLTGYTMDDFDTILEYNHISIIHKHDYLRVEKAIREQIELNNRYEVEYRLICKKGKSIWVVDKGIMFADKDGQLLVQCLFTDITHYKHQEEKLRFSEKRYEIAMQLSNITMFEYDIISGDLIFYDDVAKMYNVPTVLHNGIETFVKKVIEPVSVPEYQDMYRKIHAGEPSAQCLVKTRDAKGVVHDFELTLTNIFDTDGKPIRAIGVRKNISQILLLEREKEFGRNLVAGKSFIFEADISSDSIHFLNSEWENALKPYKKLGYLHALELMATKLIAPEFEQEFFMKLSPAYIKKRFENNENLITFDYRSKNDKDKYSWNEAIVNIIKDNSSNSLSIRFYRMDISELKQKQLREIEERKLYESMISKALRSYEINVTKNIAIKGLENWHELFGIRATANYNAMIVEFSQKGCHPEDGKKFYKALNRENVIDNFKNGVHHIKCEYRSKQEGIYKWYSCTIHLYDDPATLDIKGFAYVEDINEDKSKELLLKFKAEHDQMTGIYNKSTTEKIIKERLAKLPHSKHAFLILDIDEFKEINDNFGHQFGDFVITDIANRIKALLKDELFGRIGGDEFCVFIQNVTDENKIIELAEKIIFALRQTYQNKNKLQNISASIGIAYYPKDAVNFSALYKNADEALYAAKNNGKNKYCVYNVSPN